MVIFLHVCVILSRGGTCVPGGCACLRGSACLRGDVHAQGEGACVPGGMCAWGCACLGHMHAQMGPACPGGCAQTGMRAKGGAFMPEGACMSGQCACPPPIPRDTVRKCMAGMHSGSVADSFCVPETLPSSRTCSLVCTYLFHSKQPYKKSQQTVIVKKNVLIAKRNRL